jgi:subtilisin family serine protease
MSQYKEYVVTLKSMEGIDQFYIDMESLGGLGATPDRPVDCACRRPISRNTHYWLTTEEAEVLKTDERVLAVELTPEELGFMKVLHYTQTENYWDKSSTALSLHKNWGLLRCVLGNQISGWGSDINVNQSGTINVTSSGINVDVIIIDGSLNSNHPEFSGRFIQYNWFQHNLEVLGTPNSTYVYTDYDNHGTHVGGTATGNTQGWARNANIYSIDFNVPHSFDFVRSFHRNKSINPNTGRKNPTIINASWGWGTTLISLSALNYRGSFYPLTYENLAMAGVIVWTDNVTDWVAIPVQNTSVNTDASEAINEGIIIVGSSGNDSYKIDNPGGLDYNNYLVSDTLNYYYHRGSSPNSTPGVISVGAISSKSNEEKAVFSNCGPRINIFAPGQNIISSTQGNAEPGWTFVNDPRDSNFKLAKQDGTSMASPQVCGVLACTLEQYPSMTPSQALEYITHYAKVGQITETHGGYMDFTDLQSSQNRYLHYNKERPDNGVTYPRQNKWIRPTSGVLYPRPRKFS